MRMNDNLGQLVSHFVAERVDIPHPNEVEIWTQLVYAALFSVGFVVWLPTAKGCSCDDEMTSQLHRLIANIANDADVWIRRRIQEALQIADSNISVDATSEIRFHLGAMFAEAIGVMTERKFEPEAARSHACFVHLSVNLQKLALIAERPIDVQHVLQQAIAGTNAMANEVRRALNRKRH
jgi:hypothetical protein